MLKGLFGVDEDMCLSVEDPQQEEEDCETQRKFKVSKEAHCLAVNKVKCIGYLYDPIEGEYVSKIGDSLCVMEAL